MTTKRKRTDGTGTVYKDAARGRWVGAVTIDGQRRKVTAPTKVECSARLTALIRENTAADANTMTVAQLFDLWTSRQLDGRDLAVSTRENYRWTIERLTKSLGKIRLANLTVEHVERAFDEMADDGLSRRSLKSMRSTLAQALDFAQRRRLVSSNVARIAELTATAARPVPRQSLTPDEARTFWQSIEGKRLAPLFRLQLLTGLRPGEAAGVCWSDVDLDRGLLTVRHAVRTEKGVARLVDELKTEGSYRTIRLPAPALAVLTEQRRHVAAIRLAAGPAWRDLDLVFPSEPNGGVLDHANVRRALTDYCKAAGVPLLRPNELRHSAASILIDRGRPVELVADLLGHSNFKMLAEHYRHRVRPSVDVAVGALDDLVG